MFTVRDGPLHLHEMPTLLVEMPVMTVPEQRVDLTRGELRGGSVAVRRKNIDRVLDVGAVHEDVQIGETTEPDVAVRNLGEDRPFVRQGTDTCRLEEIEYVK